MLKGKIHSIETFGTVDGPGIRFVIFLQGCNFRCLYCHNPDTWCDDGAEEKTVDELVDEISKYKRYIEGITVSGGEPLLQMEFVTELFKEVKKQGLSTCLDTNGSVFNLADEKLISNLNNLLEVTDLVMLDIKHIDENKHKYLTGHSNKNTLEFARFLSNKKKPLWLRYVLVPTINNDFETLTKWKEFANGLKSVEKIEILPYHRLGIEKYEKLGIDYKIKDILEPTKDEIKKAEEILKLKENN